MVTAYTYLQGQWLNSTFHLSEFACVSLTHLMSATNAVLPGTPNAALVITAGSSAPHCLKEFFTLESKVKLRARLSCKWNTDRIILGVDSWPGNKACAELFEHYLSPRKDCPINAAPRQCFHQHSYSSLVSSEGLFSFLIITIRSCLKTSFPDAIELCPVKVNNQVNERTYFHPHWNETLINPGINQY